MKKLLAHWKLLLAVLILLGGIGGGIHFYQQKKLKEEEAKLKKRVNSGETDRTYKVKRGNLVIGLLQGGNINARKKHKIALQANYRTKILWCIDENTPVKAGDVLAKLETDELKEKIENLEIELDNLSKELEVAYETEKIQISTNAADLQNAEETLLQNQDAMRKYRRFERANKRDALDLAITNAESDLSAAEENYETVRDSEVETSTDEDAETKKRKKLEEAQTKIDTAQTKLDTAESDRKVFRRYDHPSKITRLTNALEQAELSLRRTRISTQSKLIQQKKSIENLKRRIRWNRTQLNRYKQYMTMMVLKAPVDGVVIYGDPDRRWSTTDVKPGLEIGKGQVIFTIPEMGNLVADFDLPEQSRSKIKEGDRVVVFPDSLPGQHFSGKIEHIDTLPVHLITWDRASPKVYKTRVVFNQQHAQLVNGMSAQISVVTKTIKNTLFIPVEAVFENNDRFFIYKMKKDGSTFEADVKLGESNNSYVQILKGVEEDDVVCLYRPYQKKEN